MALRITALLMYAAKAARLRKNPVGASAFVDFFSATFFCARKMLRIFPYRAQKNVINNRNVMCHIFEIFG
jgi:hypothetical protein